ncbi:protein of unknown function [Enterobacter cancerogenus]|nr:protein of unknown function [Enterobacter cancerogenus]
MRSLQRKPQNSLTAGSESGLMRPVARIAQSVEQGIENPRVLGSIPSPGTKFISTDLHGGPFLDFKPAKTNTSTIP